MEDKKKCTFKEHQNIDAIKYCTECKIYMCNKCLIHHQSLFENHNQYEINKDLLEIFIDKCEEKNHPNKLEFYCITHNKLCCASCITKLEGKGYGQHKDCNIDFIENIKEEKKNKLKDNIKYLENISNNLNNTINELKILFEKINENKEQLKLKIQKIFTNFRNAINEREDELLLKIDTTFNDEYVNDEIIKNSEKLPKKVKTLLEKSKLINNDWDNNNKLVSIINLCIDIENNINSINLINDNINRCKSNKDFQIDFKINDESCNKIIQNIKFLGQISKGNGLVNNIFKTQDEANDFSNLYFKEKNVAFELLYQATRDGDKISNIINKIEGCSPTLFIILTKKGYKCGGYTKALWKADSKYKYDDSSFLFNFTNRKKFSDKNPNKSIFSSNDDCLCFGDCSHSDYYIRQHFLTSKIFENTNKIGYNSNGYDVQGEQDSQIQELEVYKCIF